METRGGQLDPADVLHETGRTRVTRVGLIGVKDRVEALGGRLWLQSAPDAGTTVRAELPLGRPPAT